MKEKSFIEKYLPHFAFAEFIVIILFIIFCKGPDVPVDNLQHELDSITEVNAASQARTLELQKRDSLLMISFQSYIDSVNSRKDYYDRNQKEYIDATNFIHSASDTAYEHYLADRKPPNGYFDD